MITKVTFLFGRGVQTWLIILLSATYLHQYWGPRQKDMKRIICLMIMKVLQRCFFWWRFIFFNFLSHFILKSSILIYYFWNDSYSYIFSTCRNSLVYPENRKVKCEKQGWSMRSSQDSSLSLFCLILSRGFPTSLTVLSQSFPTGALWAAYKCVEILIPGPPDWQGKEDEWIWGLAPRVTCVWSINSPPTYLSGQPKIVLFSMCAELSKQLEKYISIHLPCNSVVRK